MSHPTKDAVLQRIKRKGMRGIAAALEELPVPALRAVITELGSAKRILAVRPHMPAGGGSLREARSLRRAIMARLEVMATPDKPEEEEFAKLLKWAQWFCGDDLASMDDIDRLEPPCDGESSREATVRLVSDLYRMSQNDSWLARQGKPKRRGIQYVLEFEEPMEWCGAELVLGHLDDIDFWHLTGKLPNVIQFSVRKKGVARLTKKMVDRIVMKVVYDIEEDMGPLTGSMAAGGACGECSLAVTPHRDHLVIEMADECANGLDLDETTAVPDSRGVFWKKPSND